MLRIPFLYFMEENKAPLRLARQNIVDGQVVRPESNKHQWVLGSCVIEGIKEIREDTCSRCGCVRRSIMRVGAHPWTDGYTLNDINYQRAPVCNKR